MFTFLIATRIGKKREASQRFFSFVILWQIEIKSVPSKFKKKRLILKLRRQLLDLNGIVIRDKEIFKMYKQYL